MKFKFPFETLMRERNIRRNEAEKEYRAAQSKVYEQQIILNQYKDSLEESVAQLNIVRQGNGRLSSTLKSLDEYIAGQKLRIKNQVKAVLGLEEIAEQKRMVLVEAAKEVKILDKLKEKRYTEFKVRLRKHEAKILDEVAIMQTVRRDNR